MMLSLCEKDRERLSSKLTKRRYIEVTAGLSVEELKGVVRMCEAFIKTDMQPKRPYWDGREADPERKK